MATLNVLFVGAQVYVPNPAIGNGSDPDTALEVYLPNATRMGDSPPIPLPMHMPTMWLAEEASLSLRSATKLRYFPWSKLNFAFTGTPSSLSLASIQSAGGNVQDRLKVSQARLSNPQFLAGQVSLAHGTVRVPQPDEDPICTIEGWDGTAPTYPTSSIVNRIHARIDGVSKVEISFQTLLDRPGRIPDPVTIKDDELNQNQTLVIGNPCAESVLRWVANDEAPYTDEDFAWIYQLVASPPATQPKPMLRQRKTPIQSTDAPQAVLQNIDLGGGGGVGCECMGCIGDVGS